MLKDIFKKKRVIFNGWVGEAGMKGISAFLLPKNKYHQFHNVTLPREERTTQIDHIFVSRYGIFVVETKTVSGWIYGGQYDKHWTQKFFRKSFKFYNPIRQNFGHIKTLESLLPNIPESAFHSVIAMCGKHKIKTRDKLPESVIRCGYLPSYIVKFEEEILTQEQVEEAVELIKKHRLPETRETKKKHVEHLQKRFNKGKPSKK